MHRIILNLVGNAIKFTHKGCIKIQISGDMLNEDQLQLLFKVSDSGIGISNEEQDKIFEKFFRVTPSFKGEYSGHGVGLHIVKKYLELLKGEISVKSQLNKGTIFIIKLPVKIDTGKLNNKNKFILSHSIPYSFSKAGAEVAKENSPVDDSVESPLILLVEDNLIALKMAEALVKQSSSRYLSATTGEKALELFKARSFDLILSDIGLPGISGIELTTRIRDYEKKISSSFLPIIGLTAHAVDDLEKDALEAGMNKVLIKPLNLEVLHNLLNEFLFLKNKA